MYGPLWDFHRAASVIIYDERSAESLLSLLLLRLAYVTMKLLNLTRLMLHLTLLRVATNELMPGAMITGKNEYLSLP